MGSKRNHDVDDPARPPKRVRLQAAAGSSTASPSPSALAAADRLSRLSDELLVRILHRLPAAPLLTVARVSRRFWRLAADGQLWRALYRQRFPARALASPSSSSSSSSSSVDPLGSGPGTDWRRAYRLRLNWLRGTCAVGVLPLGGDGNDGDDAPAHPILAKVADGLAVTADARHGLRVWALATHSLVAQAPLRPDDDDDSTDNPLSPTPTALAVHAVHATPLPPRGLGLGLDIAVGLRDGGFCAWRLDRPAQTLTCRGVHTPASTMTEANPVGAIAYAHPYVLTATATATDAVLVSLYALPLAANAGRVAGGSSRTPHRLAALAAPTARPPLALAVRPVPGPHHHAVASLAYTVAARQGWALGLQDLHIGVDRGGQSSVVASRLAFTLPMGTNDYADDDDDDDDDDNEGDAVGNNNTPTALAYAHPYLLATLPDNTLVLHRRCTARVAAPALSPGVRLWGHTAGIAAAAVAVTVSATTTTTRGAGRGRVVSASRRGDELRVWDLDGRPPAAAEPGRSVVIRGRGSIGDGGDHGGHVNDDDDDDDDDNNDNNDNLCVGLDDEHVVVLKDARTTRARLVVYNFS